MGGSGGGGEDFIVADGVWGETSGEVGDAGESDDIQAEGAGLDGFDHCAHADGIGSENAEHADFGGGFVLGTGDPCVDALVEGNIFLSGEVEKGLR